MKKFTSLGMLSSPRVSELRTDFCPLIVTTVSQDRAQSITKGAGCHVFAQFA